MSKKDADTDQSNQQSIRIGRIKARDVDIRQTLSTNQADIKLSSEAEIFFTKIQSITNELKKVQKQHQDIQEAVAALQNAQKESKKSNANPSAIRSAFYSAVGFLQNAARFAVSSATVLKAIDEINKLLPAIGTIFVKR